MRTKKEKGITVPNPLPNKAALFFIYLPMQGNLRWGKYEVRWYPQRIMLYFRGCVHSFFSDGGRIAVGRAIDLGTKLFMICHEGVRVMIVRKKDLYWSQSSCTTWKWKSHNASVSMWILKWQCVGLHGYKWMNHIPKSEVDPSIIVRRSTARLELAYQILQ